MSWPGPLRAGLDPPLIPHELRHTRASLTIMVGAPLMVVAQTWAAGTLG